MKAFFKEVLKRTIANLLSFAIIAVLALIVGSLILSSFRGEGEVVEEGAFLVIDLTMNLTDRPDESDPSNLLAELAGGGRSQRHHLLEVLNAVRKAARDDRIRGIFLHGSLLTDGYGSGFAALAELNSELSRFRKRGKPIVAHTDHPTIRDFYVLSVADELLMHPYGDLTLNGFAAEGMFYGNAFEKYGVNVQLVRTGKYKGAAEDLISDRFSEENKEQIQVLLDQRWDNVLEAIANNRGILTPRFRLLLGEKFHFSADEAAVHGLVDRAAYADEAIDRLVDLGIPDEETGSFVQISLDDYLKEDSEEENEEEEGGVAIVYVEGAISEVRVSSDDAGADEIARDLRLIRKKKKAKAVVLRVNSPGGGVTASETIQREVNLLAADIPVVVSMGSMAASGGYWISSQSDHIFAQKETITGSIGVFGLSMDFKELAESVGVTGDVVKTSPHADAFSFMRPKTEKELALVQEVVDDFYDRFLKKVAKGRGLEEEQVAAIAQGRIWSGRDARQNGLVDEFGGLLDAIDYAAKLARLSAGYKVTEYPRKRKPMEFFREILGVELESHAPPPFANVLDRVEKALGTWSRLDDPRGAYALIPWHLHMP